MAFRSTTLLSLVFRNGSLISRRIRGDDASQSVLRRQHEDMIDLFESQVRGDFDQQRFAIVHSLNRSEKLPDRCFLLQLAQIGRIGRTHVENKIIAQPLEPLKRAKVIAHSFLQWNDLGFSNIDADRNFWPMRGSPEFFQTDRDFFSALVVESEAIDQRFHLWNSENPRTRIPELGLAR